MRGLALIKPSELEGVVRAPPSKSFTHRAIIASSLAEGRSVVEDPLIADDTEATMEACKLLGATIVLRKDRLIVEGSPKPEAPKSVVDCRESASTLRFLGPIAAFAPSVVIFGAKRSLRRRPMKALINLLEQLGVYAYAVKSGFKPPIVVFGQGGIEGGRVRLLGSLSSQFLSGLLFAGPLTSRGLEIELTSPLHSRPYVAMTAYILAKHGIEVEGRNFEWFFVRGGQRYEPRHHRIEGDWSSAAFILAAAVTTRSSIKIENLNMRSLQADRAILYVLERMGASLTCREDRVEVESAEKLRAITFDARDAPDLVPVVAALACLAEGESVITGVKRLRTKECDRPAAICSELRKMGVEARALRNEIRIRGPARIRGASVDSWGDHRIAMMCAVVALAAKGETLLMNADSIRKSYPNFFLDLKKLGAQVTLCRW